MEESVLCYICYEPERENYSYLKEPKPCECKGSIVIKTSRTCSICKTKYKLQYLPSRNGLELITKVEPNGDTTEYTVIESGEKHGIQIIKKNTGEMIERSEYREGLLHGEYKTWYANGQIECHCYCFRNRIEGEFNSWYENGQIMEQSVYKDGLKDGLSKEWDKKGNQIKCTVYNNGVMF